MAETLVRQFGYLGLFAVSFLAATILPFSSEVVVLLMPRLDYNTWLILIVATAGNYLGGLTNYYVGKKGSDFIFSRFIKIEPEKIERARGLYGRWGAPVTFFSWVPVIGDPLLVVAGMLDMNLLAFTFWVGLGKFLRYGFILGISDRVFN